MLYIAIHRQTPMGVKKVVRATCLLAAPISLPRVPDPTAIYRQTFALLMRHSCLSLLRKYAPSALKSLGILKRGSKTCSSGLLLRIKGFLPDGGTIESHGVTRGLSTPRFLLTI